MLKKIVILFSFLLLSFSAFAETKVGLAHTDLTPTKNVPLGGYGSFNRRNWPFRFYGPRPYIRLFQPGLGSLDPIRAKVMTISENGKRLVFISLDVVGAPAELHETLTEKLSNLGIERQNLFVSATHTHSGPGALSKNKFWQVFAMDRFQKEYFDFFIAEIIGAVQDAISTEEKAILYSHRFQAEGVTHSRRKGNRPIDKEVVTLLAQGIDGHWLGGIVNFAIHGTCLNDDNHYFSADAPGSIERKVEDFIKKQNKNTLGSAPTILLINGAEGDVSPELSGIDGKELIAEEFTKQFSQHWREQAKINPEWEVVESKVSLGTPKISLEKCSESKWIPKGLGIRVKRFIDSSSMISQIRLGSMLLATWPGEPTSTLGLSLKEMAHNKGYSSVMVMGLTNDHLAYFTTPEEFVEGGYESCVNFFGMNGGKTVLEKHQSLLK